MDLLLLHKNAAGKVQLVDDDRRGRDVGDQGGCGLYLVVTQLGLVAAGLGWVAC